jgi:peptide deformylase
MERDGQNDPLPGLAAAVSASLSPVSQSEGEALAQELVKSMVDMSKENAFLQKQVEIQNRTQEFLVSIAKDRARQAAPEAVPPPVPALPPAPRASEAKPMAPPARRRIQWARLALVALFTCAALALSFFVLTRGFSLLLGALTGSHQASRPVIVYPLLERPQNELCTPVTPDEIRAGSLLGGRHQLVDVTTSMLYHMAARKRSGICAQHVGVPACYCALDLTRATPSGSRLPPRSLRHPEPATEHGGLGASDEVASRVREAESYLEDEVLHMFDAVIVGASRRLVASTESNVFCREKRLVRRRESVWVAFYDRRGEPYEMLFNGTHSINVQHAAEIHAGAVRCGEDRDDAMQSLLLRRLENMEDLLLQQQQQPRHHHRGGQDGPAARPQLTD